MILRPINIIFWPGFWPFHMDLAYCLCVTRPINWILLLFVCFLRAKRLRNYDWLQVIFVEKINFTIYTISEYVRPVSTKKRKT